MSLTKIIRKVFEPRQKELERYLNEGETLQREVLSHLLSKAKDTEYGQYHLFEASKK